MRWEGRARGGGQHRSAQAQPQPRGWVSFSCLRDLENSWAWSLPVSKWVTEALDLYLSTSGSCTASWGTPIDAQESLEVAIQCLETPSGLTVYGRGLALPRTLQEIFEASATGKEMLQAVKSPGTNSAFRGALG